ncbi:hypothetical protein [Mammaliicoccus sciuri]|uniref:hypothetical protein n=1 Tax=Mammaliicoccus sciuri TaxID=1296 RepID=UPI0039E07E2B
MPTIKYTQEDITKLVNELDQYRTAHDKLTAGLKEAVAESIKYKRERDSLIKDVAKLREEKEYQKIRKLEHFLGKRKLKQENKALRLQFDGYFGLWQDVDSKYKRLTEHIRLKTLHNPSVSRYKDLMHFIDELEGGFNERS